MTSAAGLVTDAFTCAARAHCFDLSCNFSKWFFESVPSVWRELLQLYGGRARVSLKNTFVLVAGFAFVFKFLLLTKPPFLALIRLFWTLNRRKKTRKKSK